MAKGGSINFDVGFNVNKKSLESLKKELQDIQSLTAKQIAPKVGTSNAQSELNKIKKSASELQEALKRAFNPQINSLNVAKFNEQIQSGKINLQQMAQNFSKLGAQGENAFGGLINSTLTANTQLKQTNQLLASAKETLANTVNWKISSSIVNSITSAVQNSFNYIKALDTSLNDIRIVTGKSADDMSNFAVQANNAAKALGQTTTAYTKASLIYYQQGLGDQQVKALADTTMKVANITGQATDQVSEEITSVMNGYQISADKVQGVMDKLAAVAATTASDLQEVSSGMSKVASAANSMGVGVDALNAQLATIVSVTRQAPESVGTALKTIYARLADLKIAGPDGVDEFGVSLGDVSKQLAQAGIQILDTNGDLRNMEEVMNEVGSSWDNWSKSQQIAVAEAMAGKRQYNNLIALFDNWNMYTEALNTSLEATGTVEKQNEIYMDSWAAKIKQLQTAGDDLKDSLINSDFLKGLTDFGTKALSVLASVVDGLGGAKTSLLGLTAIATNLFDKQLNGLILTFVNNLNAVRDNDAIAKATQQVMDQFNNLKDITQNMETLRDDLVGLRVEADGYSKVMTSTDQQVVKGLLDQKYQIDATNNSIEDLVSNAVKMNNAFSQTEGEGKVFTMNNIITPNLKAQSEQEKKAIEAVNDEIIKQADLIQSLKNDASTPIQDIAKAQEDLRQKMHDGITEGWKLAENGSDNLKDIQKSLQDLDTKLIESKTKIDDVQSSFNMSSNNITSYDNQLKNLKQQLSNNTITQEQFNTKVQQLQTIFNAVAGEQGSFSNYLNELHKLTENTAVSSYVDDIITRFKQGQISASDLISKLSNGLPQASKKVQGLAEVVGHLTEEMKQANRQNENFNNQKGGLLGALKNKEFSQGMTELAQSISQITFSIQSFKSIFDTIDNISDGVISKGQGALQIISNLAITLPSFVFGAKKAGDGIKSIAEGMGLIEANSNTVIKSIGVLLPTIGKIALVAAAISGVVFGIKQYIDYLDRYKIAAQNAKQVANQQQQQYDKTKESYDQLKTSIENYQSAQDAISSLTRGTQEWRDAIADANQQVLTLLQSYPQLAQYIKTTTDGLLKIDSDQLQEFQREQQGLLQGAQAASLTSNVIAKQKSNQNQANNIATNINNAGQVTLTKDENDISSTLITPDWNFSIDDIKSLINNSDIYDALVKSSSDNQQSLVSALQSIGFDNIFKGMYEDEQRQFIDVDAYMERLADALIDNKGSLEDLKNSMDTTAEANKLASQQIVDSTLKASQSDSAKAYQSSDYQGIISSILGQTYNKNFETAYSAYQYKKDGTGITNEEVAKQYAHLKGYDEESVSAKGGQSGKITIVQNGQKTTIDNDTARQALAVAAALQQSQEAVDAVNQAFGDNESHLQDIVSQSKKVTAEVQKWADISKNFSNQDITKGKTRDISDLILGGAANGEFDFGSTPQDIVDGFEAEVKDALDKTQSGSKQELLKGIFPSGMDVKAYAEAMGIDTEVQDWAQQLVNKMYDAIKANKNKPEEALQDVNAAVRDKIRKFKNQLTLKDSASLTTDQQTAMIKPLQDVYMQFGTEGVSKVKDLFKGVSEQNAQGLVDLISGADFSSYEGIQNLSNAIQEQAESFNLDSTAAQNFIGWLQQVNNTASNVSSQLDSQRDKISSVLSVSDKVSSTGTIISDKDMQSLVAFDSKIKDLFSQTADGWKLTSSVQTFRNELQQSLPSLDELKSKFEQASKSAENLVKYQQQNSRFKNDVRTTDTKTESARQASKFADSNEDVMKEIGMSSEVIENAYNVIRKGPNTEGYTDALGIIADFYNRIDNFVGEYNDGMLDASHAEQVYEDASQRLSGKLDQQENSFEKLNAAISTYASLMNSIKDLKLGSIIDADTVALLQKVNGFKFEGLSKLPDGTAIVTDAAAAQKSLTQASKSGLQQQTKEINTMSSQASSLSANLKSVPANAGLSDQNKRSMIIPKIQSGDFNQSLNAIGTSAQQFIGDLKTKTGDELNSYIQDIISKLSQLKDFDPTSIYYQFANSVKDLNTILPENAEKLGIDVDALTKYALAQQDATAQTASSLAELQGQLASGAINDETYQNNMGNFVDNVEQLREIFPDATTNAEGFAKGLLHIAQNASNLSLQQAGDAVNTFNQQIENINNDSSLTDDEKATKTGQMTTARGQVQEAAWNNYKSEAPKQSLNDFEKSTDDISQVMSGSIQNTKEYGELLLQVADNYDTVTDQQEAYKKALQDGTDEEKRSAELALRQAMAYEDVTDAANDMAKDIQDAFDDIDSGSKDSTKSLNKAAKAMTEFFGTPISTKNILQHRQALQAALSGQAKDWNNLIDEFNSDSDIGPLQINVDDSELLGSEETVDAFQSYVDTIDPSIVVSGYADMDSLITDVINAMARVQGVVLEEGGKLTAAGSAIVAQVSAEFGQLSNTRMNIQPNGTRPVQVGTDTSTTFTPGPTATVHYLDDNNKPASFTQNSWNKHTTTTPRMEQQPQFKVDVTKDGGNAPTSPITSSPSGGGGGCFVAGTLISTPDGGFKEIQDVQIGDVVLSYNEIFHVNEYSEVLETMIHHVTEDIYTLYIQDTQIEVTGIHQFYIDRDGDERWIHTYDLQVGDSLRFADGTHHSIQKITKDFRTTTVYNFEVSHNHNYYVSEKRVLAHNKGCFVAGTPITAMYGIINIENIKIGDWVLSYNQKSHTNEYSQVLDTMTFKVQENMYKIHINNTTLQVTGVHKFLITRYGKEQWIAAGQLQVGDKVRFANGEHHIIDDITIEYKTVQVYNFEVSGNHNYYVGKDQVLAHNKGGKKGGGGGKGKDSTISAKQGKHVTDQKDAYKTIEKSIDKTNDTLDKLDKASDKAFGKSKISNLQKMNQQLQKQNKLYSRAKTGLIAIAQVQKKRAKTATKNSEILQDAGISKETQLSYQKKGSKDKKEYTVDMQKYINDLNLGSVLQNYNGDNYDSIFQQAKQMVNAQIDKNNEIIKRGKGKKASNKNREAATTAQAQNDALSAWWSGVFSTAIQQFDEAAQKQKQARQQIQDNVDQMYQNNLQAFTIKVTAKLDLTQLQKDWADFKKSNKLFIDQNDFKAIAEADIEKVNTALGEKGSIKTNADAAKRASEAVKKLSNPENQKGIARVQADLAAGKYDNDEGYKRYKADLKQYTDEKYGTNLQQAKEDLQTYIKQGQQAIQDVQDSINDLYDQWNSSLQKISDKYERQISLIDSENELLQHNKKLATLIYGEKNYAMLKKYTDQQAKIDQDKIDLLTHERDKYQTLINQEEKYQSTIDRTTETGQKKWNESQKRLQSLQDKFIDTTKSLYSTIDQAIQHQQDALNNQWNKFKDERIKNVLDTERSLDDVVEEWQMINDNAERYIDTINSGYSLKSLQNAFDKALNSTQNSVKAQRELNALKDKQLSKLRQKDKLSQYDIDRVNKMLILQQKRLALEDAKQNKSQLKLRRDAQGNYSYQYAADKDKTTDARQEYLQAQNDVYNLDKQRFEKIQQEYVTQWQNFLSATEDLRNRAMQGDQQAQAQYEALSKQFVASLQGISQDYDEVRSNLMDSTAQSYTELFDKEKMAAENLAIAGTLSYNQLSMAGRQAVSDILNNSVPGWTGSINTMITKLSGDDDASLKSNVEALSQEIKDQVDAQKEKIGQLISSQGNSLTDLQNAVDNNKDSVDDYKSSLEALDQESNNYMTTMGTMVSNADELVKKLGEQKDVVDSLTSSYKELVSIMAEAGDASQDIAAKQEPGNPRSGGSNPGPGRPSPGPIGPNPGPGSPIKVGSKITISKNAAIYKNRDSKKKNGTIGKKAKTVTVKEINGNRVGIKGTTKQGGKDKVYWVDISKVSLYKKKTTKKTTKGKKTVKKFDTGGYTGNWNSNQGRMAILHEKELVLNKADTANILQAVNIVRDLNEALNSIQGGYSLGSFANNLGNMNNSSGVSQNTQIIAQFPNAVNHSEIQQALLNLANKTSQYIGR